MLVIPSPIKIRLNEYPANIPAAAGPIPAPRLIAILIKENDRVIFSGFAKEPIAADNAGRRMSNKALVINIPMQKDSNVEIHANPTQAIPPNIRLASIIVKYPNRSLSHPPP